ncbi:MAG: hypothetical protein ACJA14_002780, partial [Ilumatobacter sp.]
MTIDATMNPASVRLFEQGTVDSLSPIELAGLLADDTAIFDGDEIIIQEPAPVGPFPEESALSESSDGEAVASAATASDALSLNSRPAAAMTIYLDFDGETVDDTSWNFDDNATPNNPSDDTYPTINAGPYSRESRSTVDSTLSGYEYDGIIEVWERVADDFTPWDVNVTTQDPGVDALRRTSASDTKWGIRVIITADSEWYSTTRFGGVAYLQSFNRSYDLPAWVFSTNLGNGNPKSVAEAASHEVGHTLGLYHDGIATVDADTGAESTTTYYRGHGAWAPIMGVGYYKTITQWSKGEYTGANETQDDLASIDSYLPRLGTPNTTAPGVLGVNDSQTVHVIAGGGDIARHTLTINNFPATISVDKVDSNGNLLADLTVRGPSGNVVATETPDNESFWSLETTLENGSPTGSYLVEVRSIGWGTVDTGFSP